MKKAALFLSLLALVFSPFMQPSEAHETREAAGKYKLIVGYLNEPPFTTELNGVHLQVTDSGGGAVQGLEKTLTVKIICEGADWSLSPRFRPLEDKPGAYAAYFMPTRSGKYIFEITGEIEGASVNERFESGPDTFSDIEPVEPLEYPDHRHDEL